MDTTSDTPLEEECLWSGSENPCQGEVVLHAALSGTGTLIPYCSFHWDEAVEKDSAHRQVYPDSPIPPAWFDPLDAGERWDDD